MRLASSTLGALLTLLAQTVRADTHCYGFRNDSKDIATISFTYHPAIGNVITGAALEPGKTYPFDGRPWCWNLPEDVTATVAVSGAAAPQWKGSLLLGNRSDTAPSGTYVLGSARAAATTPAAATPAAVGGAAVGGAAAGGAAAGGAAAGAAAVGAAAASSAAKATTAPAAGKAASTPSGTAAPSATCLANSFPDNDAYCLTALKTDVKVDCGTGHTGVSGFIVVDHLTVQCQSGRKFTLTCGTTTGGRQKCALNDYRICTDEHVRNAAEFCGH
jgi:hypothetical protein